MDVAPLANQLLERLSAEEGLLRDAREGVLSLHAALRNGRAAEVQAALSASEAAADRLRDAGDLRRAVAVRLARAVGLEPDTATLAALADRLPDPHRGDLLRRRTALRELTVRVDRARAANAILIDRLRSYFRDVLSGFIAQGPPSRYGPSGAMLSAPAVGGTVASG